MPKLLMTFAAVLLFAACPGGEVKDVSQSGPKPSTVTATSGTANAAAASSVIAVDLLEYEIRMQDSVQAGKRTFSIINHGKEAHSFKIEGNGLDIGMTEPLERGDTGQITVALTPGTYTIYCPVDGHKGKGMSRTLRVD
ncbi:MAG: hypothetical protein QOI24_101 [Acidobacteriota bacterium]|nr:hypothetical protein [Acidobacteriota bacterium]